MNADAVSAERSGFEPPAQGGVGPALVLALLVHALLILALSGGLRWKNEPQDLSVEAELWSPVPQQAAPRPVQPPPAPPPAPTPAPPPPQPTAAEQREADIVLAQKKKREEEERLQAQAREAKEKEKRRQQELERQKKEKEQRELAEKKAAEEAKRKQELLAREKADKEAETVRRMQALRRMAALAGTADSEGGNATVAAGPSATYAGLIRATVRPNIVFTDDLPGNPVAEVEVTTGPTGQIVSRRITKSSGVKSWDEAVLRALDRTDKLPSDRGRYWNPMTIAFKLRE